MIVPNFTSVIIVMLAAVLFSFKIAFYWFSRWTIISRDIFVLKFQD